MRKLKFLIRLTLVVAFTWPVLSCSNLAQPKRGVIITRTKPFNLQASKFMEALPYHPPIKILFRDSQVIAVIPERIIHRVNGVLTLDSIGVHHYAFLDLKTRKCSEYLNFSDTASLIKSYILADSVSVIGGLTLFLNSDIPNVKSIVALPDTVIDGVQYQRNKVINTEANLNFTRICYFRCDKKGSTVKYFGGQKEKGDCPMTKYDLYIDEKYADLSMELDFISSKLSHLEEKIFKTWGRNQK